MAAANTDKFRKSYSFTTKALSSTIGSGDSSLSLNNYTNIPTDTGVDIIVDRIDSNGNATPSAREIMTGVCNGSTVTNLVRGVHGTTAQSHASGAVVELVASGAAWNDAMAGILAQHNQDGTHGAVTTTSLTVSGATILTGTTTLPTGSVGTANLTTNLQKGWESHYGGTTFPAPNTVTALGNRSYSCVFNGVDLTGSVSAGMRLRTTRTVPAPTQCTSLNGTTQYYSKTSPAGMTFTNFPVASAWVKLSSYSAGVIISRYNGTSGWMFSVTAAGVLNLQGFNAGAGNYNAVQSYQSIPLNKWVHVSAQLDMSTSTLDATHSWVMIDGVNVPAQKFTLGTNPTSLIQAGNLEVGSTNGGTSPFPGKLAQVAIYSAAVTQATILASIHQTLAGTETSLISAYSFNNAITDLNANANNLTANGSAVATNADSPFGGQADGTISSTLDYAEILSATFSTNTTLTVRVPDVNTIPTSGGVSAVSYSTQAYPYGWPGISNILGQSLLQSTFSTTATPTTTDISGLTTTVYVPYGRRVRLTVCTSRIQSSQAAGNAVHLYVRESTTTLAEALFVTPVAAYSEQLVASCIISPTAGSHTYLASASQDAAGTLSITIANQQAAYITAEVI